RALITFSGCRKHRLVGCELHPLTRPELDKLMPAKLITMVELAQIAEPAEVGRTFAAMSEAGPASKQALVKEFAQSISANKQKLASGEVTLLERSLEALGSQDALPTARLNRLVADFRRIGDAFAPRGRGWPVAIMF